MGGSLVVTVKGIWEVSKAKVSTYSINGGHMKPVKYTRVYDVKEIRILRT